jgi:acyl transferase domain-containing protein/NADPH:quinone reductase-like Zn-dependent oxidoreductase/NAD(P)-dependent dehydrogenase (short-subunit alcohol dehydrogenase family)
MRQVYENCGLNAKECGFVEANGTGSKSGDPVEVAAIYNVLGQDRDPRDPLYIGSVKSNVGNLGGASGVISVIKAVLMLERGFIVPNHDFKQPNPKIPIAKWYLKVPATQRPWPKTKKYISVNNFGFGGTNAHAVLEKSPFVYKPLPHDLDQKKAFGHGRRLFVFSADDKASLETFLQKFVVYLEQRPEVFQKDLMHNVAYTLGQRRSHLQWRIAVPGVKSFDLIEALSGEKLAPFKQVEPLRIAFVYTGQGAQWAKMGKGLYEEFPDFQTSLDKADNCLTALGAGWSLAEELMKEEKDSKIHAAHISFPACTAIQLALTDMLKVWGVQPTAVVGHSSGEIAAAYSAGILSFDASMSVAYHCGRLVTEMKDKSPNIKGSMMAIGGSKEDIEPLLSQLRNGEVKIACYNSPSSLTIAGDQAAITELQEVAKEKGIFNLVLATDAAYHSRHMNHIAKEYKEAIQLIDSPKASKIRFHSALLGRECDAMELGYSYWVQNITSPVRFSEAVVDMIKPGRELRAGVNMLLEIGPHAVLQNPIQDILTAAGSSAARIAYSSVLIKDRDSIETAMEMAAMLFARGADLNLEAMNFPKTTIRPPIVMNDLPSYPWNHRSKYWRESRLWSRQKTHSTSKTEILGTLANWSNDLEPTWRNVVKLENLPWLSQYQIHGSNLFPFAGYLAMAIEAASQKANLSQLQFDKVELRDVLVVCPLHINAGDVEMTITLKPHQDKPQVASGLWEEFKVCSWTSSEGWRLHCSGLVAALQIAKIDFTHNEQTRMDKNVLSSISDNLKSSGTDSDAKTLLYESLNKHGVTLGPSFQCIDNYRANEESVVGRLKITDLPDDLPNKQGASPALHPTFLEGLMAMYWPLQISRLVFPGLVYLPSSVGRLSVSLQNIKHTKEPGNLLRGYCRYTSCPQSQATTVQIFATPEDSSDVLLSISDLTISPVLDSRRKIELGTPREICYKVDWEPVLSSIHSKQEVLTNGAAKEALENIPKSDVIIIHGDSVFQRQVSAAVAELVEGATGKAPEVSGLLSSAVEGKLCIFLTEIDKSLLSDVSEEQFNNLRRLLTTMEGMLWVVRGASDVSENPHANMVSGLSRSIRSETLLRFATLDLDSRSSLSDKDTASAIFKIFSTVFDRKASINGDLEFMERGGAFYTPRIIKDEQMNEFVHRQTKTGALEPTDFAQAGRPLKLSLGPIGGAEDIHFIDATEPDSELGPEEMRIQVVAVGVNYQDVASASKRYRNTTLGLEAAGVVTEIGRDVKQFEVGDRIVAITEGAFASSARVKSSYSLKIPSDLSAEDAATIPIAYCTAYYAMVELGGLKKGESVLIQSGASAAGQAAVLLAQMVGSKVYATVESQEKKDILIQNYSIPEENVFYSDSSLLSNAIRQTTNNAGVDLILSPHSSRNLREVAHCLNKFGRFLDVSDGELLSAQHQDLPPIGSNARFMSVDISALAAERPELMAMVLSKVKELLSSETIRPISPATTFPISEVGAALKAVAEGSAPGKVVVVPQIGDIVQATSRKLSNLLSPDGTYILIGGTGGLGRSIARWMVEQGGKHIVLVSRSGSPTGKVQDLIEYGKKSGANIIVRRCNVANQSEVGTLINTELRQLPPIKGVIHGAMVLHDVLFEKMTHEEYISVIESKVQGAWNLHLTLANSMLDFFVALSSAAAEVGNRGQAAYAAADCFLNAFVQYRRSLGFKAASIGLTAVSDIGYLAENAETAAEVAKNLGSDTICEAEVLTLLGAAISERLDGCNSHTITGMRITPSMQPFWTSDAKFKHLREEMEAQAAAEGLSSHVTSVSWNDRLKGAKSPEEAHDIVCKGLLHKTSVLLSMPEEGLSTTLSLSSFALDSLVLIEMRNFIAREFEANMQVMGLLSGGSVHTLAKTVCGKSKLGPW